MLLSPSAETPPGLNTLYALSPEHATPTWMVGTPQSATSQSSTDINVSIQALHHDLVFSLASCVPNFSLEQIVTSCIDVYMQRLYAIGPQIHEPSLRLNAALQEPLVGAGVATSSSVNGFHGPCGNMEDLARLRSYTLTTAICAVAAFLLPPEIVADGALVGHPFLRVSREMLKLYHDDDIEHPNSSSLVIRISQAGALHTNGKTRVAWQVFRDALQLAEQMRLFDERSFDGLDPMEARMRRIAFWQLYILEKYAAMFEGRPMMLNEFSLNGLLTTKFHDDSHVQLINPRNDISEFDEQIIAGFYTCQKLWATASDVLLDLQTLSRLCRCARNALMFEEAQRIDLTGTYIQFLSVLDNLPPYLQSPESVRSVDDRATMYQRRHFWVQRTNLLVTYHCLRMILLQRVTELGLASLLGLSVEGAMLNMRKTEIAHDLINVITSVPFDSLRASGESCVSFAFH
jgi:hypothetical protein